MKAEQDEQLLQLVSDALRDGPGSAAWQEAVRLIDPADGQELDALYSVRQRLESGKRWRQIRPGTNFTRKVMDAVDQQSDASVRPTGPATIIAILCGLLVLVVIAALVPMLISHSATPPVTKDAFANVFFSNQLVKSDFEKSIGGEWKVTGTAPIKADHGLRSTQAINNVPLPWGLISTQALPADSFFDFSVTLDFPPLGGAAEVFLSDGDHEIVATMDGVNVQVVLPKNGPDVVLAMAPRSANTVINLRWLVGPDLAVLEMDGRRIWQGENHLSKSAGRFVGMRFLPTGRTGHQDGIEKVEVRTKN